MNDLVIAGISFGICSFIFIFSHFLHQSKGKQLDEEEIHLAIFWQRPILTLFSLFVLAFWAKKDTEKFAMWLVFFYLLLLLLYTTYSFIKQFREK